MTAFPNRGTAKSHQRKTVAGPNSAGLRRVRELSDLGRACDMAWTMQGPAGEPDQTATRNCMERLDFQLWTRIGAMNRRRSSGVAQTFLSAGSGDFPVASLHGGRVRFRFTDTGQECPVNPRTGMSALQGSAQSRNHNKIKS